MRLSGKFKTTHSTKVTGFKLALFWALPYHWAGYFTFQTLRFLLYILKGIASTSDTSCLHYSFFPFSCLFHLVTYCCTVTLISSTWRAIIYTPLATLMMPLPCVHAALFLKVVFRNLYLGHTFKNFFVLTKYQNIAYLNFSVRLSSFYHNFHLTFWTLKLVY